MNHKALISFNKMDLTTIPHYYDYAIAIEKVIHTLQIRTGKTYEIYSTDE